MDKTAVAVIHINCYSEEVVVALLVVILSHYALDICVTGKRINRGGGYRLEIPANFYFYGPEKAINWLKIK